MRVRSAETGRRGRLVALIPINAAIHKAHIFNMAARPRLAFQIICRDPFAGGFPSDRSAGGRRFEPDLV